MQLFTWFYLAPLTLLFVVLVCALLPLGSILLVVVYGLPLAALWEVTRCLAEAPPGAPPYKPRSFEARRGQVFLCMGLAIQGCSMNSAIPHEGYSPPPLFGWLVIIGLPAMMMALYVIWRQWLGSRIKHT